VLLTLSTTHSPATDLGYLLHKNPGRAQSFKLNFGVAHVVYPQADDRRCTCALAVDIDPVALVRDRQGPDSFSLSQYVNDRPYAASSLLSVAIAQVFGTALSGICKSRQELCDKAIPLEATIASVPSRGREGAVERLFEPLGYTVTVEPLTLDERFPSFGGPRYANVSLRGTVKLADLLSHLYVLLPVLDGDKHYWIGQDEVEKLLRHGEGWLASHPEKPFIVDRYLMRRRHLTAAALERLVDDKPLEEQEVQSEASEQHEEQAERPIRLNDQRMDAVMAALVESGAKSVLDLGCSNGNLLKRLLAETQFTRIVGYDVSHRALEVAADRLRLERLHEAKRDRIELMHGSLVYRDRRLESFDAAAVIEVVEHLDPPRLAAFERGIFAFARPRTVVLTTPNVEYNVLFEGMEPGKLRHRDHRFEWTRAAFQMWANRVAATYGYTVRFEPIGPVHPEHGSPTQMTIFTTGSGGGGAA
jgi:3' terminal RNA ribose 2'-O-methyltransferase Hen1